MALGEFVKYRSEFVDGFAQTQSLLMDRCVEESMTQGGSVVFDIADLSGELPERGVDGRLARLSANDSQVTAVLKEYGGRFEISDFEKFKSQSDERSKMNKRIYARANRRMDRVYIAELNNASTTWNSGTAITVDIATIQKIIATLGQGQVPINPNDVTWVVTPQFYGKLMGLNQFTSADWINSKPFVGGAGHYDNTRKIKSWADVGWVSSPLLPGVGTATATTFIYHRNALGCAAPSSAMMYTAGFDDKDHLHYAAGTIKAAVKILQQGGIIKVVTNDS
jgi:uncharacterized protein YhdP